MNKVDLLAQESFWLDQGGGMIHRVTAGSPINVELLGETDDHGPRFRVIDTWEGHEFVGEWAPESPFDCIHVLGEDNTLDVLKELERRDPMGDEGAKSTVKTLFLFEEFDEGVFFFELEGDYSRFNNIWIGTDREDPMSRELNDLVYDEEGMRKVTEIEAPTRDWTHFVRCGIL